MKKISTMFGLVLFVFLFGSTESKAQSLAPKADGLPSCLEKNLIENDFCQDEKGKIAIVTSMKHDVLGKKTEPRFRSLTKKELHVYELLQSRKKEEARADFYTLKDFCGGLTDKILDRDAAIKDVQAQIDAIDLAALQAAEKKAYNDMLKGCRRDCLKLAMVKDGVCALTPDKLAEVVSKKDLQNKLLGVDVWFGGQTKYIEYIHNAVSVNPTEACSAMLQNPICKLDTIKNGFTSCKEGIQWVQALNNEQDTQKQIAELKAKQSIYAKNSVIESCVVRFAADVKKPYWDTCSLDCLQKALDSCPAALKTAEAKLAIQNQNSTCPSCSKSTAEGQAPVIRKKSIAPSGTADPDGGTTRKGQ